MCSGTRPAGDSAGTTTFVYDADGQLAVAYGGAGAATGTTWLTDDQLGSTRVVTDAGGSVVSRLDYLPFGEEISGTVRNARSGVVGYSTDGGVKVKFTGKERDAETGLDYFGVRYFSGAQGRFTSPDTPFADQDPESPQTWNLYAYGRNNPLVGRDDDGHAWHIVGGAVSGYLIGGGIELGKQLIKGELIDFQRINAKGVNGAVVGGTAAATGGLSIIGAAGAMGFASMTGGAIERSLDGDSGTAALDPKLMTADAVLGAGFGAASQYGRQMAAQALEKTGEFTQKITRGESLRDAGRAATDAAKVRKGQAIIDAAKSAVRKRVGDPASTPLTIKQETASEIISVLRQEELKRKRLETQQ